MSERRAELRKFFEGQKLEFVKWGYKRENHEVRDALNRAASITYSVSGFATRSTARPASPTRSAPRTWS